MKTRFGAGLSTRTVLLGFAVLVLGVAAAHAQTAAPSLADQAAQRTVRLPNGWSISPLGDGFTVGDLVLNIVRTPDGRRMIALNSGYNEHALTVFELDPARVVQRVPLPSSWLGMAWSPDGKRLYVSGGNDRQGGSAPLSVFDYDPDGPPFLRRRPSPVFRETFQGMRGTDPQGVRVFPVDEGEPTLGSSVFWSGLHHHPQRDLLYAANRTAGIVVVFDSRSGAVVARVPTGVNPYALVTSADGETLFVSNWGSDSVSVIDTKTHRVRRVIPVGDSPNDMVIGSDGLLFVACANDNSVTIVDTKTERAVGRIVTSMWERDPAGSTPNALLLDDERHTLYVANADNNNVAVIDVSDGADSRVLGFLPTAAYPSAIALSADGRSMAVGSSKGVASASNLRGPYVGATGGGLVPADEGTAGTIKNLMAGSIHVFDLPASGTELRELTAQVYRNSPYHERLLAEALPPETPSVVPSVVGQTSAIKHVIYILKENRTYDQLFGDIPRGRGDPRIAIFGRQVTPNHHALAEQFTLFDNYFVDAEVSIDGHSWSDAAYATDFIEKTWPADYGRKVARPPFTEAAEPPSGYIWDLARRAGLTYRSYGERTSHPSLSGHVSKAYKGWGADLDLENADVFISEFDEFERSYDHSDPEKPLPAFTIVSLPNDHTYGTRPGRPTPIACVAANDVALGRIVERVTRSRYWPETAIFVTEDDAQDGSDHVDCHRSILLAISPYTKRGLVDHTHYTTSSILRTIELLLGLPPMSQFDAGATPLYKALGVEKNLAGYEALPAEVDLSARNTPASPGAQASLEMDFEDFDRAPMFELNEIIWKSVHGADSQMPLPVRRYDVGAVLPELQRAGLASEGDKEVSNPEPGL